jgi:mannose-6-phosphate isomerase-like protein (cupin superfamily)
MGKYDDGMVTYDDVPAEKCKIVPPRTWFWLKQKPAWSRLTNVGVNDYAKGENEPDYHRHECHEVYILAAGNLIAHVDGKMLDIHPGDCVPIAMGTRHQVYQVPRPSILVFFYSELHGLKRYGHIEENKENWIL